MSTACDANGSIALAISAKKMRIKKIANSSSKASPKFILLFFDRELINLDKGE